MFSFTSQVTTWFFYTACGHRMAHRKWKKTKQEPSMFLGPAVPGCNLVSFHFLWAILCLQAVVTLISASTLLRIHIEWKSWAKSDLLKNWNCETAVELGEEKKHQKTHPLIRSIEIRPLFGQSNSESSRPGLDLVYEVSPLQWSISLWRKRGPYQWALYHVPPIVLQHNAQG